MKLDVEQMRHLAKLSRLDLDDEHLAVLQGDLAKIMAMAEQVENIDTSKLAGVVNVHEDDQPLRADLPLAPLRNLSADAAQSQDGMVVVPPVLGT